MCGIVGHVGPLDPSNRSLTVLMDGLGRLEYRGYDSAGVALLTGTDPVEGVTLVKVAGKLAGLRAALDKQEFHAQLAHLRAVVIPPRYRHAPKNEKPTLRKKFTYQFKKTL